MAKSSKTVEKVASPSLAPALAPGLAPAPAPSIEEHDPDDADFTLGNPRTRSKPGQAPGEKQYEKVRDSSGRLVSKKPANVPYLAYQKYKAEKVDIERRRAAGEIIPEEKIVWTWGGILLTIAFLISLVGITGNFVTGSPVWGRGKDIQKFWEKVWPREMLTLTPEELSAYDGTTWHKPIYIGLDGEVWDVSASTRLYGKGGAYHVMAGRDAARAFVTGCFQSPDHLTPDTRGFGEEEWRTLNNWKTFFRNHEVYRKVGNVIHPPIDPKSPIPTPCQPAPGGGEDGSLGAEASKPDAAPAPQPEEGVEQKSEEEVLEKGRSGMGEL